MKKIGDHIDFISGARDASESFARLVKTMSGYGYDMVSFGCATDCPSLGLKKRHGHISNFPAGWLKHYAEKDLSVIDPVHMHLLSASTPTFWSSCLSGASEESVQLMRDAADEGLKSGITIPLCDMGDEISFVSMARNCLPKEETYEDLAAINLISAYFFQNYKAMTWKPDEVELTLREYEILNWAAEGKTDAEIAMLINISAATVRYHWKKIFEKLDAHKRTYATMKAVQMKLVTPRRFFLN